MLLSILAVSIHQLDAHRQLRSPFQSTNYGRQIDGQSSNASSMPHLSGIFLSLYSVDLTYSQSQWDQEFEAMAKVGISFAAVRAAVQGTSNSTQQGACKLGSYEAFYPSKLTPAACYTQASSTSGGNTLEYVLNAATKYGLKVHLTPAMPHTPYAWPNRAPYWSELTALQANVFIDVWTQFPQHHNTIIGAYIHLLKSGTV
jgi:hypothetical protein